MTIPFTAVRIVLAGLMLVGAEVAFSQNYPNKVIRIVTTEPGTAVELVARLVARGLNDRLGQPVVVENRGIMAIESVAKAPADGYTLLIYTSPLWLMPLMRDNVPWDAERDFAPITLTVSTPNVLVVHPSVPAKSVYELVALVKSRPGVLNYGSGSTGSSSHLAAELFKTMADINIIRIPYKGAGPALNALLGGQVQLLFATTAAAKPHVKSGRLKILAITTAQPSALAPDLPTVAASGVSGYESTSLSGMLAPAKTPAALIKQLNQETVRVLSKAEVKERLFNLGVEIVASSPEQFAVAIKADIAKWGKVITDAGIHED